MIQDIYITTNSAYGLQHTLDKFVDMQNGGNKHFTYFWLTTCQMRETGETSKF